MYAQRVTVHYVDETSKEVTLTQWSMGQFAQYGQSKGWKIDMQAPGLLAVVMLRYQAYCEMHRDPQSPRPTFDRWDMTVSEVVPVEEPEEVDPTGPAPSGG
jgi:exosome complex RNA-binding protein Rrp4